MRFICAVVLPVLLIYTLVDQFSRWLDTGVLTFTLGLQASVPVTHLLNLAYQMLPLIIAVLIFLYDVDDAGLGSVPLAGWPSATTILSLLLLSIGLLACLPNELGFLCRGLIVLRTFTFTLTSRDKVEKAKKRVQSSAQANPKQQKKPDLKPEGVTLCSVCKQESLYMVCKDCEKEYQAELQRVRTQLYRAKSANLPATLTLAEWLNTLKRFHHKCAYCQVKPYEVLEHYIPIIRGGGTTAENCVPACFTCNSQKSSKEPGL